MTPEIRIALSEVQEARIVLAAAEYNFFRLYDEWDEFICKQQETGEQK